MPLLSIPRLEYKYSKLVMNAAAKESELPAPDSCAIMEGEDAEDDLVFASKKSLFGKIKSLTSKVRGRGGAQPQSRHQRSHSSGVVCGCSVPQFPHPRGGWGEEAGWGAQPADTGARRRGRRTVLTPSH